MNSNRRVVVTGLGAITSLGHEVDEVFDALLAGRSGIRRLTRFDTSTCPSQIGGEVTDFKVRDHFSDRPTLRNLRHMDMAHQWAMASCKAAAVDAGLEEALLAGGGPGCPDPERVGVSLGAGLAGRDFAQRFAVELFHRHREEAAEWVQLSYEELFRKIGHHIAHETNPMLFFQQCPSVGTAYIAMRYGAKGPNLTLVSLCAAGAQSLGEAAWTIARGDADVMLAGGADSMLNLTDLAAFATLRAVSHRNDPPEEVSSPFDLKRDGCVVGEGAAFLVLEELEHARRRGARVYCELAGYGTGDDAYKISAPHPEGLGAVQSMRRALRSAGLRPEDIGAINAHGTSTPLNDRIETRAIRAVFGDHAEALPVVSTKSMTGHLIAAAGALEGVISVKTLQRQRTPPTINLRNPDPSCDLDYVPEGSRALPGLKSVLSNSFAIGGVNATLIFSAVED